MLKLIFLDLIENDTIYYFLDIRALPYLIFFLPYILQCNV